MRRAIIYGRTAVSEEEGNAALMSQEAVCRAFCERHRYEVIEVVADVGLSGNTLDRPGLSRVRALVADKQAQIVVVETLDRLTRNAYDWLVLYDEFAQSNTVVVIVADSGR